MWGVLLVKMLMLIHFEFLILLNPDILYFENRATQKSSYWEYTCAFGEFNSVYNQSLIENDNGKLQKLFTFLPTIICAHLPSPMHWRVNKVLSPGMYIAILLKWVLDHLELDQNMCGFHFCGAVHMIPITQWSVFGQSAVSLWSGYLFQKLS